MTALKHVLSATAIAALMSVSAVALSASPASARVVCNAEGDCWHTDGRAPVVPGVTFSAHPDDWYFHQHWDDSHHFRDYHDGRGYYKGGVWITL